MKIFTLEHSPAAYLADFVVYPLAILASVLAIVISAPIADWLGLGLVSLSGLAAWTLVEYGLHRYVLHGLQPFKRWHKVHHERPHALIGTSTLASFLLFVAIVFAPLYIVAGLWFALAATTGLMTGYLFYVTVHHAVHHWRAHEGSWFYALKRAHALHHRPASHCCYGVTTTFWDWVFSSR